LEHASVIDMIIYEPATDESVLIMVESRAWDGSEERLFQLQEKMNAYLSFALDGEMAAAYPALAMKQLRVQLETVHMPDPAALQFLQHVYDQIALQGIKLEVRVKENSSGGCGAHCACVDSPE
jgi:hypothetical protein